MKINGIIILSILILNSVSLHAASYSCLPGDIENNNCFDLIKFNSAAALGECLPEGSPSDVEALLKRNNITGNTGAIPRDLRPRVENSLRVRSVIPFNDLEDPRMLALTRVVGALDKIGNGNMNALREGGAIQVIFAGAGTTSGNSRRNGSQIQLVPGDQNMDGTMHQSTCGGVDNIGLIAHEIGHYIAGNNNDENFNKYKDAMRLGACRLSQYCIDKGTGEEFAEVVAAYITHPEAFIDKGANCRRAFNFMKGLFGEPNMTMSCEARKNSYDPSSPEYAGRTEELLRSIPLMQPSRRLRFSPSFYNGNIDLNNTFQFQLRSGATETQEPSSSVQ